jgi:hypothetical protein
MRRYRPNQLAFVTFIFLLPVFWNYSVYWSSSNLQMKAIFFVFFVALYFFTLEFFKFLASTFKALVPVQQLSVISYLMEYVGRAIFVVGIYSVCYFFNHMYTKQQDFYISHVSDQCSMNQDASACIEFSNVMKEAFTLKAKEQVLSKLVYGCKSLNSKESCLKSAQYINAHNKLRSKYSTDSVEYADMAYKLSKVPHFSYPETLANSYAIDGKFAMSEKLLYSVVKNFDKKSFEKDYKRLKSNLDRVKKNRLPASKY